MHPGEPGKPPIKKLRKLKPTKAMFDAREAQAKREKDKIFIAEIKRFIDLLGPEQREEYLRQLPPDIAAELKNKLVRADAAEEYQKILRETPEVKLAPREAVEVMWYTLDNAAKERLMKLVWPRLEEEAGKIATRHDELRKEFETEMRGLAERGELGDPEKRHAAILEIITKLRRRHQ